MGKVKVERKLADDEAMAFAKHLKTSPQKLNLVAGMIRGKKADAALAELAFSQKRISGEVRKVLQSAIANAENNHQLDVDNLFVKEVSVGRSEEHTSELQSLMRNSYAVFCLKKKNPSKNTTTT